jgi:hypothetical protein
LVFFKEWPKSRKESLFSICFLVAVLPMLLTVLFRVFSPGAIGPWIGVLAIVNGIVLPFLFFFAIVSDSAGPGARLAIGFAALVLGEFFAIFGMYLFTRLAGLLGVLGPVLQ